MTREIARVRECLFYNNTKLRTQFYISGLLGNRDGSDQSVHSSQSDQTLLF